MHYQADDGADLSVSEAYSAARELLHAADADAAEVRRQADRYLQRREHEAELLVAKARRVLTAAEDKAATLVDRAREQALEMLDAAEAAGVSASVTEVRAAVEAPVEPAEPVTVIDLVAEEVPEVARNRPAWKVEGLSPSDSGLDRILASAISHAVQRAFPADG